MAKRQYTLAGDLLVLAVKSLNAGNTKAASKLFASACVSKDINNFIDDTLSVFGSKHATLAKTSARVIASLEQEIESSGPIELSDLKKIVAQIHKHHASDESDLDEEYEDSGLDIVEEDDTDMDTDNVCSDCESEPCICEYDTEGTGLEESSSVDELLENVKTGLVAIKVRANDWQIRKYLPILIKFFPNLPLKGDRESDIGYFVNLILNQLKSIDYKTLQKLEAVLQPLILS